MSRRDRIYTFAGILLALFLGAIDQTIVATALPRVVEDLGGLERYAWVFTAYLVASTVLVPIYGKLADMYSRKVITLMAVGVFLTGSFLCGIAGEFGRLPLLGDGMNQLIVFRALQGLGAAGLFSMAFIVIADLFPPAERGRYQGVVSAVFGIASVLGPLLGGFLTDHATGFIPGVAGWRWVFYVNLPFGALAVWFIATRMPPLPPRGERRRLDVLAVALLVGGLVPVVTALQLDRSDYPWGSPVTLGMLGGGVTLLALFVWRSLGSDNPILDLGLFRNRVFRSSVSAVLFHGAAFLSMAAFLPLFLVNVLGVSATRSGLALIPLSLGVVFGSLISGQVVSRIGRYRAIMLVGTTILVCGVFLLSRMTPDVTIGRVTLYMVIVGLGIGPSGPLYTLAVQNAVDVRRMGQATSATQFFRQIGGAVGTAVLGTVLATSLAAGFAEHLGGFGVVPEVATSGEGVSAAGNVTAQVEAALASARARLRQAVEDGDGTAVAGLLTAGGLSADEAESLAAQVDASTATERQALADRLDAELAERAGDVLAGVTAGIRATFAEAITNVYTYVLGIALAALALTTFIPVLPLRRTFETAPAEA
ncbi:MAG TPA: MDR family MFS transporter [Trueperaceae bacterium]